MWKSLGLTMSCTCSFKDEASGHCRKANAPQPESNIGLVKKGPVLDDVSQDPS